jgi:hypothetical protein
MLLLIIIIIIIILVIVWNNEIQEKARTIRAGMCTERSYTVTDALPPILPACRQTLLPACVLHETPFVTRDFFCSENLFVNRSVRDDRHS